MHRRLVAVLAAVLLACVSLVSLSEAGMTLGRPQIFLLRFSATLRNPGEAVVDVRLELPVLAEGDLPVYQRVLEITVSRGAARLSLDGQGRAVFSLGKMPAGGLLALELTYRIEVRPVSYRLPLLPREDWPSVPSTLSPYFLPEEGIEADNAEIVSLAKETVGRRKDPVFCAKALYTAANLTLTYDVSVNEPSALAVLRLGRANCEGYARLYAALCRAAGLAARLAYGLRLTAAEFSAGEVLVDSARHVWNEVYLAGLGWVPVDPTFTHTVDGKREVTYDYFARLGWNDLYIPIGYNEQKVAWTYRAPPDHPGLEVEHHLHLRLCP